MRKFVIGWAAFALVVAGWFATTQYMSADDTDAERYAVTWHPYRLPNSDARSVDAWVEDDGRCHGGVPVIDRLRPAHISYGARSVTISLDAEEQRGFNTCPKPIGPGANTTTIALNQPLGDRELIDGHASSR